MRVVVAPLSVSPPSRDIAHKESTRLALRQRGVRFAWFALAALTATPLLHHAAGLAVQRVRTFSDLGAQLPAARLSPESPFLVGARSVRALAPRPAVSGTPGTRTVAQELSLRTEHERLLKEGLNVPHSHPHAPYLHSLIDRVGVLDLADLTAHDRLTSEKAPSFGDPNFRAFRFSEQPRPPETEYESPVLAQPIHCYESAFTDPRQLLTPECAADLFSWLDRARVDICNVRDDPSCRRRPPPFVRGQSCFVPEARGCVFDLRVPGQVKPLAFNEALRTTLDTSSIHAAFPGGWGFGRSGRTWPDQRVLSYLEEGVRFEVKGLPLQIVLFSHLESAPMGFASLQSEVRRFMGLQPYPWMELFTWPPFFPIRCLAHGAAGRVLEPDRWRSTTEAGGPRYILFDQDGVLVPALNELSKESGAPPEVKPRPDQLAHDVAILNSAAELIPDVVYMGTDDVKDFFQHLAIAPSEFWFSTFLTLLAEGDLGFDSDTEQIAFVAEYRLGFGHFIASNIAQRFSTLLVALIELEYEVQYRAQLETHAALHPPLQEWLSQRARLNQPGVVREDRLHTIKMYTDDLALAAVSVDGFIALLIAEHVVFARLNLIMAIAAKRTLGVSIQWLGVIFVTCAGLVFVPRNKILRAIASLRKALAGEATLAELRSLLGLLEHVKGILRVSRSAMHGLWRPFKGNFDPAALYAPQPWAARKLLDWVSALARSSGSLILDLLPLSSDWLVSVKELAAFSMRVTVSADAARAHRAEDRRGLGGYFHGFYFHFALVPFAMELLAIGILELLALIFAILTFYHLIPPNALVDFETDSLSSTFSLVDEIARTLEGQLAMGHLLASQAFLSLKARSSAKHIFGSVNACADRASRNKLQELRELCKQLGVRATPVQPAAAAVRIFHDVLRAAAAAAGRSQEYFEYIGTVAADLRPPGQLPAPAAPLVFTPLPLERTDPPRSGSSDCPLPQEVIQFLAQAGLMASINLARQSPSVPRRSKERGAQSALAHALQQARSKSSARACGALPHGRPPDARRPVVPPAPKESKLRKRQLRTLRRAVGGLSPACCSVAAPTTAVAPVAHTASVVQPSTSADHVPTPRRWIGPAGAAFGKRKPKKLPDDWVTLQSLRSRTGRINITSIPLQCDSPLVLRTSESSQLIRLDGELQDVLDAAPSQRSLPKDESAWNRYWEPVCAFFNTDPVRAPPEGASHFTAAEVQNELKLLCWAIILIMAVMAPRSKKSPAAKPQSGHSVLQSVRRMHNHLGILMVPFTLLSQVMKGLKRRFVERHGHEALLANRKRPLFYKHLVSLLAVSSVLLPGGVMWQAGSLLGVSTTAMICLCYSSGFRKAEITTFDSRSTPLVFSSLVWHLQGTEYFGQPPFNLLRSPTDICCVAVYPRQSKCDFTAEIWGDKPSYHHFSPALGNAFRALAQLELMADIKGLDARRATPLYIDNERNPVSPSLANSILAALLLTFLTASQALCLTWHSFRIGLATRLHRAGISDADIQAICRWQSMESLKIYIKMTMEDYKDKLSRAHEQQGTVGSHPLCTIDSTTALGEAAGVGQTAAVADTLRQPLPPVLAADSARVASSGDDSDIEPNRPADLPAPQSLPASAPLARADVVAPTPPQISA